MSTPWIAAGLALAAVLVGTLAARGETRCARQTFAAPPAGETNPRLYAPERDVDILHLALDITPDFTQHTITGRATLTFKALTKPARELQLDAVDLRTRDFSASVPIQATQNTDRQIIVTFKDPLPADREVTLTVDYWAEPRQGLYFRTPDMGYPAGDTHLYTQGETIMARHWYPSFDAPNELFTSEVTCRVPEGMTVLSNGRQVSAGRDPQTGLVAFHWKQEKPHVNYLIALVAGHFNQLEERHGDLPLTFATPPSEFAHAPGSFRDTRDMVAFFEREIGVPYPWAKYGQVCVHDFVMGGMENTSLTILGTVTLFPPETENIRSSQGLVAHELAHQWFGDLVTCKDWSHTWLNEGFATYYEKLYALHKNGPDEFRYGLYQAAREILGQGGDTRPIVTRDLAHPDGAFSYLTYPKAAWVLHMLRAQLGPDLYRQCIQTYLQRHAHGNVGTEDLVRVLEELSGRPFDRFFDQWIYHGGLPELAVDYAWDESAKQARLSVRQVHAVSDKVLLFQFPLAVRFKAKGESVTREVTVREKEEDFRFDLPEAPQSVRLDPDYTVLAKVRFDPPAAMLRAQLEDPHDVMGRLLAVASLARRRDKEAVAQLQTVLNRDPFYGVRLEASEALRQIGGEDALTALLASTQQADARVRRRVREDLRAFYRESVLASAREALATEKNPDVLAQLIRTLGAYPSAETREALLGWLRAESFRNVLADAAIEAMQAQADPAFIPAMLEALRDRRAAFTTGDFAGGLSALARLARGEENKDAVRDFLVTQTEQKPSHVRRAALAALGELGDPKAIGVVQTFARGNGDAPERQAAEQALTTLRAARRPVDDYHDLRNEVLNLQKENRELRKDLDDVKQRLRALTPPPAPAPPPPPAKEKSKSRGK